MQRSFTVCRVCCNFIEKKGEVTRGVERSPSTYTCLLVDKENNWKVYVDRHTFVEKEFANDNCFDKQEGN